MSWFFFGDFSFWALLKGVRVFVFAETNLTWGESSIPEVRRFSHSARLRTESFGIEGIGTQMDRSEKQHKRASLLSVFSFVFGLSIRP